MTRNELPDILELLSLNMVGALAFENQEHKLFLEAFAVQIWRHTKNDTKNSKASKYIEISTHNKPNRKITVEAHCNVLFWFVRLDIQTQEHAHTFAGNTTNAHAVNKYVQTCTQLAAATRK